MRLPKRPRILPFLNLVKLILALVAVLMFMQLNFKLAQQQAATRIIAQNTNNLVKSQGELLKAIKQVTTDGNITAAQQTAIVICMLQVEVPSRTTDLQAQCRTQARIVSGDGSVSGTNSSAPNKNQSSPAASSTNTTPPASSSQPNNVQPASKSTIQKVEDTTANVVDFLWPFN